MTYYNWTKTSLYNTSTSDEYNACLSQLLVPERVDTGAPEVSPYDWRVHGPGQYHDYDDVNLWPTSLGPEANFESVTSGTSYQAQIQGYDQWLYPGHHWPATGQYVQPDYPSTMNCDTFFASAATLETSEVAPVPSNNRKDSDDGQFTETLHVGPQTSCQPSVGSARMRSTKKYRRQPYVTLRPYCNKRTNAEASSPNPATPPNSYVALPPANPSGGTSADAETEQTETEGNETPVSIFTVLVFLMHLNERSAPDQMPSRRRKTTSGTCPVPEADQEALRLGTKMGKAQEIPIPSKSSWHCSRGHRDALGAIEMLYPAPASDKPSLIKCGDDQKVRGKRNTEAEREDRRRKGIRALTEEISKFYELPEGQLTWKCPRLLSEVLRDIEPLPEPLATPPI